MQLTNGLEKIMKLPDKCPQCGGANVTTGSEAVGVKVVRRVRSYDCGVELEVQLLADDLVVRSFVGQCKYAAGKINSWIDDGESEYGSS